MFQCISYANHLAALLNISRLNCSTCFIKNLNFFYANRIYGTVLVNVKKNVFVAGRSCILFSTHQLFIKLYILYTVHSQQNDILKISQYSSCLTVRNQHINWCFINLYGTFCVFHKHQAPTDIVQDPFCFPNKHHLFCTTV